MKKALLLSVVASSMIMAGGDIAPVEPVVEAPAEVAGWEFSGTAKVYYQTAGQDVTSTEKYMGDVVYSGSYENDIFKQESSAADFGLQLRATNSDLIAGIGAGVEVSGLSTLNLENWMVSNVMQGTANDGDIDDLTDGGWISQMYLTYGFGNTSIKAGRQELPKGLSPFAFSEDWNVFKNTFDAVLVVNSDLPDTALVGAWVAGANFNAFGAGNNITDFNSLNDEKGVWMLTAQNKSIANLTLTGSYYFADDFLGDSLNILWGDAQYDASSFNVGIQGGTVMHDAFADDIVAFGAKVGAELAGAHVMAAYSNVNDGGVDLDLDGDPDIGGIFNIGGTTSALYTDLLSDQVSNGLLMAYTRFDMDKFVVKGNMDALGGNISAAYGYTDFDTWNGDLNEFNLGYTTNITDALNLNVAYAYIAADLTEIDGDYSYNEDAEMNVVRVIATYNF
ncbi:hypothetical protein [Sulfurovum mangrovi]|uniref:hypothetical protein n=1 Tax=Sulfurovum mangrovi TaxID=2893889 RepID=UPI001E5A3356|nr:hypothetical protein [Sulfurovum mangrovi]UFH59050.1 hypothetical protein LN246_11975 [Sulfurovum mangrovi]